MVPAAVELSNCRWRCCTTDGESNRHRMHRGCKAELRDLANMISVRCESDFAECDMSSLPLTRANSRASRLSAPRGPEGVPKKTLGFVCGAFVSKWCSDPGM